VALRCTGMVEGKHSEEMDGPVAAPDHHTVVFENDFVRVLETVIRAGDTTPLHTHFPKHVMIVSSGSHFIRRDANGTVLVDTQKLDPPFVVPPLLWSDGTPAHTLENTGDDEIRIHAIELKE
jgi:hypothetical protein